MSCQLPGRLLLGRRSPFHEKGTSFLVELAQFLAEFAETVISCVICVHFWLGHLSE